MIHQTGLYRVLMNISNQRYKVFHAVHRFAAEPILKQMSVTFVLAVEILSVQDSDSLDCLAYALDVVAGTGTWV